MRKIKTRQEEQKKKKRNQILFGLAMIILLTISTAGFALFNQTTEQAQAQQIKQIQGHTYQQNGQLWLTTINSKQHAFFNTPDDTKIQQTNINITTTLTDLINKPLYFVNPDSSKDQITFNLYPEYILRANDACLNTQDCPTLPVKDCTQDNIIITSTSNQTITTITQKDKCIYIQGNTQLGADKLIQELLNI